MNVQLRARKEFCFVLKTNSKIYTVIVHQDADCDMFDVTLECKLITEEIIWCSYGGYNFARSFCYWDTTIVAVILYVHNWELATPYLDNPFILAR